VSVSGAEKMLKLKA